MAIILRNPVSVGGTGATVDFYHIPEGHVPYDQADGSVADSGLIVDGRDLRTSGSLTTGPSSVYLGDNFRISNGINAVAFRMGNGMDALGLTGRTGMLWG